MYIPSCSTAFLTTFLQLSHRKPGQASQFAHYLVTVDISENFSGKNHVSYQLSYLWYFSGPGRARNRGGPELCPAHWANCDPEAQEVLH